MPHTIGQVAPVATLDAKKKKKDPLACEASEGRLPLHLKDVNVNSVMGLENAELLNMHRRCHQLFAANFRHNTKTEAGELSREQLVAAHRSIAVEMRERGFDHKQPVKLLKAAVSAVRCQKPRGLRLVKGTLRALLGKTAHAYAANKKIVVVEGDRAVGEIKLGKPVEVQRGHLAQLQNYFQLSLPLQQDLAGADGNGNGDGHGVVYAFPVIFRKAYPEPKEYKGKSAEPEVTP